MDRFRKYIERLRDILLEKNSRQHYAEKISEGPVSFYFSDDLADNADIAVHKDFDGDSVPHLVVHRKREIESWRSQIVDLWQNFNTEIWFVNCRDKEVEVVHKDKENLFALDQKIRSHVFPNLQISVRQLFEDD